MDSSHIRLSSDDDQMLKFMWFFRCFFYSDECPNSSNSFFFFCQRRFIFNFQIQLTHMAQMASPVKLDIKMCWCMVVGQTGKIILSSTLGWQPFLSGVWMFFLYLFIFCDRCNRTSSINLLCFKILNYIFSEPPEWNIYSAHFDLKTPGAKLASPDDWSIHPSIF